MPDLLIRPALAEDCRDIARMFLIGSEGLAELIWSKEIEPGEGVIDVGARRCARRGVAFSYEGCLLAKSAGRTIALLHAYPMDASADPAVEMIEPVLRPFATLRDVGSLYISALVVDTGYRGSGVGSRLLATAHARALAAGLPRLSVLVLEQNEAAVRFYRRTGFAEVDRAPLVPHPALPHWQGCAILLARPVTGWRTNGPDDATVGA